MQLPKHTYGRHDLVVKKEAWVTVLFALPTLAFLTICLFFGVGTKNFFKEHTWVAVLVILAIVTAAFLLIYNGFDNRMKLAISKDGIWTAKLGLINWDNIQYYHFEEIYDGEYTASSLKIKLLYIDSTVDVNISMFNTNEKDIENAINYNSGNYNVIQLLKETKRV